MIKLRKEGEERKQKEEGEETQTREEGEMQTQEEDGKEKDVVTLDAEQDRAIQTLLITLIASITDNIGNNKVVYRKPDLTIGEGVSIIAENDSQVLTMCSSVKNVTTAVNILTIKPNV